MNLLTQAWMPVRTVDGSRTWVSPAELSRNDLVAFDAVRADFNGALAQFAIGLLQTTSPAESRVAWGRLLKEPPDETTLRTWFEPCESAFECDGDGARFMQDFDLRAGDVQGIGALLIEAPGKSTSDQNRDLFVKRGQVQYLCPHCTALALFTLQLNAPEGGSGHCTSLRGGGPLTTLLVAEQTQSGVGSLWHSLWFNVLPQRQFAELGRGSEKTAPHLTFPWLASTQAIQADGGQTTSVQVHPAHVFWAMPRRIRLDLDTVSSGECDLCGHTSEQRVQRYFSRPHGLNYKGVWSHPLSPYYETKEGMLPLHPQPDGLGYKHWLGWVLGMQNDKRKVDAAAVVSAHFHRQLEQSSGLRLRLWVFGFDTKSAKVRCWYEATLPLYQLDDCTPQAQTEVRDDVGSWINGAELATSYLRGAVKDAWFGHDARGDFGFVDASFWSATEPAFYQLLRDRIHAARLNGTASSAADSIALSEQWLRQLKDAVLRLFDNGLVGTGAIAQQNPARIASAHRKLRNNLYGPKLRTALVLPVQPKKIKAAIPKPSEEKA